MDKIAPKMYNIRTNCVNGCDISVGWTGGNFSSGRHARGKTYIITLRHVICPDGTFKLVSGSGTARVPFFPSVGQADMCYSRNGVVKSDAVVFPDKCASAPPSRDPPHATPFISIPRAAAAPEGTRFGFFSRPAKG